MQKSTLSVCLILIMVTSSSFSQIIKGYGIKLGTTNAYQNYNYSSNSPVSDFDTDKRWGINTGIFLELLNIPNTNVVAEINYNQKGMKDKVLETTLDHPEGTGDYITFKNRIDYITVSMMGKLNFNISSLKPYILLGPRIDIQVDKKIDPAYDIIYDKMEKNIYGFCFGIGNEIDNILPVTLLIEFQYNYDFTELYSIDNLKIKNNSFDLKVGVKL